MNVAEYIAEFLAKKQVRHVFGYQGGAILKLVDAIKKNNQIDYIQNYHEQASSFCADAYSRVTGNIGVALATSGPGAINLISGIVNAHYDSIPCLFLTGQDYLGNIEKPDSVRLNGFQDVDIVAMVKPVTKYANIVRYEHDIRYELEKAYQLAVSGRPGAVLLDIPIDIQFKEIDAANLRGFDAPQERHELNEVGDVISMLRQAQKPVILAGGGIRISGAQKMFCQFAGMTKIPVVTTLNGLDAYGGAFGFAGLHGNTYSNMAILNADLLVVLGARLGQRQVGKNRDKYTKARVIHVDIDKSELNRALEEDLSIQSDLKVFLARITEELAQVELPSYDTWYEQVQMWAAKYADNTHVNEEGVDPVILAESVASLFDDDAIVTADIGHNQMWVAQGLKVRNEQRLLNSSGLGAMGYSLPAAIGAKMAKPNNQVIAFSGDGGLQMNVQELLLVGHKQLDIKIIVFNNGTLGAIREAQDRYFGSCYYGTNPEDFVCADLRMLARTFGLRYAEIKSLDGLAKIERALSNESPYLIDVKLSINSKCLNRYDDLDNIEGDIDLG